MLRHLPLVLFLSCAGPASAPEQPSDLESALAAVDTQAIGREVAWIADDARGGRDTPSEGLEATAVWLAEQSDALGLEPLGEPGATGVVGWRDPFPLTSLSLDRDATRFIARSSDATRSGARSTAGELEFVFGEDYFLRGRRQFGGPRAVGELVFVGQGRAEDLEGLDLTGRWVLVHDSGRSLRRPLRDVEEAGAIGAVALPGPEYDKRPYAERFGRITRGLATQTLSFPGEQEDADDGPPPFPVVYLAPEALERLQSISPSATISADTAAGTELGVVLDERRAALETTIWPVNIAAVLRGTDPDLAREVIVLSAHYDHVGTRDGEIFNGADDNASGTAGLLGAARVLTALGPRPRSVLFLWVSAEEKGLWGSLAWAQDPPLPEGWRAVLNVNLDMIGRTAPRELHLTPSDEHEASSPWSEQVYTLAPLEGFDTPREQDKFWKDSDHHSFSEELGIPVIYLSSGDHDDYHKPSDTADKVDADKIARIARVVARLAVFAADAPPGAFDATPELAAPAVDGP